MEELITRLIQSLGEDPTREGLVNTPRRVSQSLKFLTQGYEADIDEVVNEALFDEDVKNMIIVRDIEVYSLCEHHMLPFFGRCHVGYIPNGKVIGVSKLPRIVDVFARRLQLQERLTKQIATTLKRVLDPIGVGVVIEARHLCMMMRGVEKQNSNMLTSSMMGLFRESQNTRNEFLHLIRMHEQMLP
jgi:GTP cyclohydrolase I